MVYTYDELQVGDSHFYEKTFTDADVLLFSAISGDGNPMHTNEEFAKKTKFGRRICHGAMTSSLISNALTRMFPTSIYISQYVEFLAPVFIGDTITANLKVTKLDGGKNRVWLRTWCTNQKGDLVIEGEAKMMPVTREMKEAALQQQEKLNNSLGV